MTTKVKKASAFNPEQTFTEHINLKVEAARLTTRSNSLKTRLKDSFASLRGVTENEKGSKFFYFKSPIFAGKKNYIGMENRRQVSTVFNEEEAEKRLRAKGVYAEALSPVIDQNKIYVLHQEGKLSAEDIDAMFTDKETWAFWPIEGDDDE